MDTQITSIRVRAVYHDGILSLLDPLDLPEGSQVQIDVRLEPEASPTAALHTRGVYPPRFVPAISLRAITGIIAVGGDALAESEALYD
jgi:hypothetical protein